MTAGGEGAVMEGPCGVCESRRLSQRSPALSLLGIGWYGGPGSFVLGHAEDKTRTAPPTADGNGGRQRRTATADGNGGRQRRTATADGNGGRQRRTATADGNGGRQRRTATADGNGGRQRRTATADGNGLKLRLLWGDPGSGQLKLELKAKLLDRLIETDNPTPRRLTHA